MTSVGTNTNKVVRKVESVFKLNHSKQTLYNQDVQNVISLKYANNHNNTHKLLQSSASSSSGSLDDESVSNIPHVGKLKTPIKLQDFEMAN